jgi:O-antigen ligase
MAGRLRTLWFAERERSLLFLALAGYLLVVCASLLVASDRIATVKEIIKWSESLAVVALSATYLRSEWRVRALVWAILGASVAEAMLGDIQWVTATGIAGPGGESLRVFGTFDQPNPYAGFLNFGILLALALALFGRDARERWVAGGAGALLLVALALAGSRGAALGLVVALMVMLVVRWHRERLAVLIVLCAVPLLLVGWLTRIIPTGVQRALLEQTRMGEVNNANFSTVERIAHWIAGARMFLAHPILGVGAGNYSAAYQRYALPEWPDPLGHAHNYYINAAAETGALGCLMFLALSVAALYLGWRTAQRLREAPQPHGASLALALGMLAALVALTTHNLTDDLFVHAIELQFALMLGGLLALLRIGAMPESSAPESSA